MLFFVLLLFHHNWLWGTLWQFFSDFCAPLEVCFDWLKFLHFWGNLGTPNIFLWGAHHQSSIQKFFKSIKAILVNRNRPPLPKIKVAFLLAHAYISQTNYRIRARKNTRCLGLNPRPWAWLEHHEIDTLDSLTDHHGTVIPHKLWYCRMQYYLMISWVFQYASKLIPCSYSGLPCYLIDYTR